MKLLNNYKNYIALSFIDNEYILLSKFNKLYKKNISTDEIYFLTSIPCSLTTWILLRINIVSRMLRLDIRLSHKINQNYIIVVFNKSFYEVSLIDNSYIKTFSLTRGKRPLSFCTINDISGFDNSIYFGEYINNFERNEIHIYKRNNSANWEIVYTFPKGEIEHVHSIITDKFNDCLWIFTGDFNSASAIWMAKNNFKYVEPVLRGKQEFRACVGFPVEEGLLYATDSQFEKNSIRLLQKDGQNWKSREIIQINGPAIYGCKILDQYIFSTSVEGDLSPQNLLTKLINNKPGSGIIENYSHIIVGTIKNGFKTLYKLQKDNFPFILFQFGVFTFPTGDNLSNYLYVNTIALKHNKFNILKFKIHSNETT
jgi:hypothetical protein